MMATLREYFETDFSHTIRLKMSLSDPEGEQLDATLMVDYAANNIFVSIFVPREGRTNRYFQALVQSIKFGSSALTFSGNVILPSAKTFHGSIKVQAPPPELDVAVEYFGEPDAVHLKDVQSTGQILLYAETQLTPNEILELKKLAVQQGARLFFRSSLHAIERNRMEKPLAFIAHDSRDKEQVARPIATTLQRMMAPVWYDEFSLKVGDNLRETIESGLKTCRHCIIVLSENFFSNKGWTKREFDSIFTREILEQRPLVLPVWVNIDKQDVYDYSPGLLNVKGIDWSLGQDEVCRQLHRVITE